MASNKEIIDRLNELEVVVASQNKLIKTLTCQFAWYWLNNKTKAFAVISRIRKEKAELIVFYSGWSGGMDIKVDCEIYVADETLPDDEQQRAGKWEPMLTLCDLAMKYKSPAERLEEEAEKEKAKKVPDESSKKAEAKPEEPPADSKAENPLKGKLANAGK